MADSNVIIKEIYPIVSKAMDTNSKKFFNATGKFFQMRHNELFDIAPYDRIYYNATDEEAIWNSLELNKADIELKMRRCFWYNKPYNPQCVKEPYVITLFCIIRYLLKNNNTRGAEQTAIYLAFTGKFYASLHGGVAFPTVAPSKYKSVMEYVINNMLTDKHGLKKEGTVFGAVASLCRSWMEKYKADIKGDSSDDRIGKLIQQLRDREKSFLMNIAKLFYDAWQNRNFLNYETDSLDPDEFRLTDNDAATAYRITEKAMNYLTSNYVSLDICNKCKDVNVKATEVKDIIESILGNNDNLNDIRRVINIMIADFMRNNKGKSVGSIDFVAYSLKPQPNTKDPLLIEMRTTLLKWLDENSPNYRKRRSRKATAASYQKSISLYFILVINKVAR